MLNLIHFIKIQSVYKAITKTCNYSFKGFISFLTLFDWKMVELNNKPDIG